MIYIIYKMDGDVSGHWDESYFVDDYLESITQEKISSITKKWNIEVEDINKTRWIEVEDYDLDPYSSVIFFNDSISSKLSNRSITNQYTTYKTKNDNIEQSILDYKVTIRDNKIDSILS